MPNRTRILIQRGALFLLGLLLAGLFSRETPCSGNESFVAVKDDTRIHPCECFSETYFEARDKFRQAVKAVATNTSVKLYTYSVFQDGGDDYTMDIAVIEGSKPGTVIHTSGYHGVEGYAGSAIQVAWLNKLKAIPTQDNPTLILVHVVNPWGMATFRRTNENNVDLNRNGLHQDEWKEVLNRDPNIGNYQDFDLMLFNPRRPPTLWDRYCGIYLIAGRAILQNGISTLKRAMVSGQYHYEKGIFYGGTKLQPSLQILYEFLEAHVPRDKVVTMINVHTGLGPSGQDTIITASNSDIRPQELHTVFTESKIPSLTQAATEVAAGYDLARGTAEHFFSRLFSKESHWIVTQEFGTIRMEFVGIALILENMARQYLPTQQAVQWTKLTRIAFYKRTAKWRKDVLVRGLRVLQQAIERTVAASAADSEL